jgi:hypothetical protein
MPVYSTNRCACLVHPPRNDAGELAVRDFAQQGALAREL